MNPREDGKWFAVSGLIIFRLPSPELLLFKALDSVPLLRIPVFGLIDPFRDPTAVLALPTFLADASNASVSDDLMNNKTHFVTGNGS